MSATTVVTPIKYNNIPADSSLLKNLKKLGRDEKVKYRVCGSFDPEKPDKFYGRTLILPTTDQITDPDTSEVYDIAYIKGLRAGGIQDVGDIVFDDFHASTITLFGNSADDQGKYKYIELCNYLAQNPNRFGKDPLIERVDEKVDLSGKRDKRKRVTAALNSVAVMTDEEILNFVRANRMPDAGTPESRRATVEDFAELNPDQFATMPLIDYTSLYTLIDNASKAKLLQWNNVTRDWLRSDGVQVLHIKKGFAVSQKEELAQFLMSPEGHAHRDWFLEQLKKK